MTMHLYTPTDTKVVRKSLLSEQCDLDALTGLELKAIEAVLDHNHDTQFVRGVLHRQSNVLLGKIENAFDRYLKWWYPDDLQTFLRKCADYLDKGDDHRYLHPGWIKKAQTEFNKLNEPGKKKVLVAMSTNEGKNSAERKLLFKEAVLTRNFTFAQILELIGENK